METFLGFLIWLAYWVGYFACVAGVVYLLIQFVCWFVYQICRPRR